MFVSSELSSVAETFGTPIYVYKEDTLVRNIERFLEALAPIENKLVCFAVKANSNLHVLRHLQRYGIGGDCVSGLEVKLALLAGIPPDKIIFSGVGKTREEIQLALECQIRQINVESLPELMNIEKIAKERGLKPSVAIRFNPNIDAKTHPHLTTGCAQNKFGFQEQEAIEAAIYAWQSEFLHFIGLSCHIGSQIDRLEPFQLAFDQLAMLGFQLISRGVNLTSLDFGGGVGIKYREEDLVISWIEYGKLISKTAQLFPGVEVLVEPGRCLVADTACLLAKVTYVKTTPTSNFLIVDGGMNDLIRPALYGAYHACWPVSRKNSSENLVNYCVVGPVCESADDFHKQLKMPEMTEGDLVALANVGAYGMSMASEYNQRPIAAEILLKRDGQMKLIRRRRTLQDMLAVFPS